MGKYSQTPFYGTLTGVVPRMILWRQWVACVASILMAACFAAVNAGNGRSVAGIMQLIKGIEIDFADKPDIFVYSHTTSFLIQRVMSSFRAVATLTVGLDSECLHKLG